LIVTSPYPPGALHRAATDRAIASRLEGMCRVIEIRGNDKRLMNERSR
jgi:DNA replication protein DnaC